MAVFAKGFLESKLSELALFLVLRLFWKVLRIRFKIQSLSVDQENIMNKEYVTKVSVGRVEAFRMGDSRGSLDSVIYSWLQSDSPETIADNSLALTPKEVYGAIAFYLDNRGMIDECLRQAETHIEEGKQEWRSNNSYFYRRLLTLKEQRKKQ
jgi:hypothetical protein